MKLIIRILLIASMAYLFSFYLPWWIVMIVSGIVSAIIYSSGVSAFIAGFLGVGVVWFGYSFLLDYADESFFSNKIIELFPFENSIMLILISGVIGGLAGGFGALVGHTFRGLFEKKKSKSLYS